MQPWPRLALRTAAPSPGITGATRTVGEAMGLIAAVLIPIMLFFWFAFCFTVIAWLKAISHLCFGNFIRAAIWFNVGTWLLFWWFGELDIVNFWPGAITFVLLGVLGTLVQYQKRKAMLAIPTWTSQPMPKLSSWCPRDKSWN